MATGMALVYQARPWLSLYGQFLKPKERAEEIHHELALIQGGMHFLGWINTL
jgi:hypothetical protein